MQITSGIIQSAQKVVIYGPEGIGKSTFAAQFPNPVFIDTEGSTKHMNVARLPKPSSWTMLLEQVRYIKKNPHSCSTLIIDTADWAEQLCSDEICSKSQKTSIEDFGYGKGYFYLTEEFGKLLNLLEEVIEAGVNVVITAHSQMRKFEQPDEMGGYDRWEMKLLKRNSPLVREWADMVLFANYKTLVINVDGQGATKGKNKAQGGKRVMYTSHHPCWDAKNRHNLSEEIPFEFAAIAHCIPDLRKKTEPVNFNNTSSNVPSGSPAQPETPKDVPVNKEPESRVDSQPEEKNDLSGIPKPLADLMELNSVKPEEIQLAVSSKGYYPKDTPIQNYDQGFIDGVLVAAWPQVFNMIKELRQLPF